MMKRQVIQIADITTKKMRKPLMMLGVLIIHKFLVRIENKNDKCKSCYLGNHLSNMK